MKKLFTLILLCISFALSAQTITVTAPNGGELLVGCNTKLITWNHSGTSTYFNIDYSIDNGATWSGITSAYLQTGTTGSFNWTIPASITSVNCLIKVYDQYNTLTSDLANAVFTINAPVLITAANGGEIWQGGTTQTITWNTSGTSNNFRIEYSTNGGIAWTTIIASYNTTTGTYSWLVPNTPSTQCLIRITDTGNSCKTDVSNNFFTISPATPVITITSPNGAENWYANTGHAITWNCGYLSSSNVKIEYSTDNGSSWTTIISSTATGATSGSYNWIVPNTPSTQCLVRVSDAAAPSTVDVSNAVFTILPPYITVNSPNGGEIRVGCNSYTINWAAAGTSGTYKIEYSTNGGSTWTVITNTATGTNYNWSTASIPTTNALIRVSDVNNLSITDQSNSVFTIEAPIIVTSPNGGEVWQGGTIQNITWSMTGASNYYYNIQYSTDGGTSWNTVVTSYYVSSLTAGSYAWTVPNTPSTNCLVRVVDYYTACKYDVSNAVFTITPATPVITLTAPNTAVTWYPNSVRTISWTCNYLSGSNVKLEYSTNNGSTWSTIIASTPTGATSGTYNWTIPNTPSTQCLVRVSDALNASTNDISNVNFTIGAAYITLTAPNGGQTFTGCNSATLSWTAAGTSGTYKMEYSLDGGSTWVSIGTTTSTTYNWTIPAVTSTNCLIRISDNANTAINDQSDAVFTIHPAITVTSPNGGEVWQGGTNHTITWTMTGASNYYYNLYYSTDGGTTWTTIATSYYVSSLSAGSYNWLVPNIPSTNCLIKVTDYYAACKTDVSNSTFTITPATPVITLNSPNGGESWYANTTRTISWSCNYLSSTFVTLQYSTDNGTTWNMISSAVTTGATSGSYNWVVPNTPSTQCLVKVSDYGNSATFDISNAVFTILPAYITVTSPNGGNSFVGCNSTTITWTAAGTSGTYKLEYSADGGTTWTTITSSATGTSYNWSIPAVVSSNCMIRVSDQNNLLITDASDASFTLNPAIIVTAANGGESWQGGTNHTITWSIAGASNYYYNIYYSIDNGTTWNTITTFYYNASTTSGSYNWLVPNTPSTTCLIKVTDYYTTCKTDVSNSVFTITPATPVLQVSSPNGGESWYANTVRTISWTCNYLSSSNVKIEYSIDNGTNWNVIIASTPTGATSGNYNWTVPNNPSTQCLVRVSDAGNLSTNDISNSVFTILPAYVTISAPNGGQTFTGCNTTTISWTASGTSNNYKLEYTTNNGTTWNLIVASVTGTSYNWTLPLLSSTTCKVRITDNSNALITDESNAVFTINAPITVGVPNGGEVWQGGTNQTITWTMNGASNYYYNLYYSLDNGVTWTTITTMYYVSSLTNGSYNWLVPNTPSTNCLIKITDYYSACKTDISNSVFTITPATPVLTLNVPNGGQLWYANTSQNITWNCNYLASTNVMLEYSTDNGTSWNTIISSTPTGATSGSYSWLIPNTPSPQCLVRVTDVGNTSTTDVSNSVFTILPPYITVTAPNGGQSFVGCNSTTIAWTAAGTSGTFNLQYSYDGGASWNLITNSATGGSYNWTMPSSFSSSICLIKVSDASNLSVTDQSDAMFTINQPIIVTSPNGGEVFSPGSTQLITWTMTGSVNYYYNLQYSIDGGANWTNITTMYYVPSLTSGSYNWTVPNVQSSNCLIRVTDYYNACRVDQSNSNFTIGNGVPTITVTAPNGGQTWYFGQTQSITWTNAYLGGTTVKIEYSIDNGTSWNVISASAPTGATSGSYAWTVPSTASTQCLVRVSDAINLLVSDVSNAVFTIAPNITVTAPNGGEILGGCTVTTLTWNAGGTSGNYRLEYSTNNGTSWNTIIASYSTGATNCTYNWTVANTPSTTCLFRVTDTGAPTKTDVSNATFTINPTIIVTAPNFGGTIQSGTSFPITWTSQGVSGSVNIDYTTNGGTSWNSIAVNYSGGSPYNWLVPVVSSTTCLIRITDNASACKTDNSDMFFTINGTSPALTVTSPNGGETFASCTTQNITWNYTTTSPDFKLEYSLNGTAWTVITPSFNCTGSPCTYAWNIPNIQSPVALVRVSDVIAPAKIDQSNASFVITGPVANAGTDQNICPGGTANLSATGGVTYSWTPASGLSSSTISNPTASPTATTTYTVTATDVNGCYSSDAVIVKVNPVVANAGTDVAICNGSTTTLSASGGVTYSWSPATGLSNTSSANPVANPTVTTTYSVAITNTFGCTGSDGVIVTVNPLPTPNAGTDVTICQGSSTTLNATGGNSYTWSPSNGLSSTGIANPIANPTSTLTYTVTATNAAGCRATDNVIVNILPAPMANAGVDEIVCAGNSTTLGAGGGISYTWNPGATLSATNISNPVATPTVTTTYSVTATGANGCTAKDGVILTINTITPNAGPDQNICTGASANLSASGGTIYRWSPVTGLSNPNISNPVASPVTTTTYTVTVSSSSGCFATDVMIVNVNPVPTPSAGSDVAICSGSNTVLTASGGNTYNWTPVTALSSSTSATPTASPTSTITYTVTATSSNGCKASDAVIVTVNPLPTANAGTDQSICSGSSANLLASGGITYSWTPSATLDNSTIAGPVASPLTSTTYSVTVTDNNGCKKSDGVIVSVVNVTANAGTDVSICIGNTTTLNATGGTSYNWSPGTGLSATNIANPIASPLVTTTYTVTVTGASSCTSTDTKIVTVNPLPTASAGSDISICTGTSQSLSASGGVTYNWIPTTGLSSSTSAAPLASPTTSTTYSVTVTDGNGCKSSDGVIVSVNTLPTAYAGVDESICSGNTTSLGATGGVSYTWNPSADLNNANISGPVASPVTSTTYSVTVTDNNGCTAKDGVIITVNSTTISAGSDVTICPGSGTTLTGTGGTSYTWGPGTGLSSTTTASTVASPLTTTTYTVTGTAANGCSSSDQVIVSVNTAPTVVAGPDVAICAGSNTTLSVSGAVSYTWSPATGLSSTTSTNPIATPVITMTYTVTGTSSQGCIATDNVIVTVNPLPVVDAGTNASMCPGSSTNLNGTGGISYLWTPATGLSSASVSNPIASPSVTTTYTMEGTDVNGCSNTDQVVVTVNSNPVANAGTDITICPGANGNLSASGGTSYSWSPTTGLGSPNSATTTVTASATTTYTVTATNASGCTATDAVIVNVNQVTANAGSDAAVACGNSTTLSASGGTTYNWSPSTGLSNINIANPVATPATTTSYTVTATSNGCINTDVVVVTVNDPIVSAGTDKVICQGAWTTLTATGGTSATWSPTTGLSTGSGLNVTASPTSTITYTATITNSLGCTATDEVIVTVNPLPTVTAGSDLSLCSGACGILPVSGAMTYTWVPGGMTGASVNVCPSNTTTYTVTGTDMNGCSASDVIVAVVNTITANAGTDITICSGSTGNMTATGGTSYTWSPSTGLGSPNSASTTVSVTATTTYTVTATGNGGCTSTDEIIVNVNTVTANAGNDVSVACGNSTTLTATGGSTYQWSPATGLSNASIANPSATPSVTTSYTVTAFANGCSNTDVVVVSVTAPIVSAGNDVAICEGASTNLTATGGTSATWSPTTGLSSGSGLNVTATPVTTTTYTATITNSLGCTATGQVIVTVNPLPIVSAGVDISLCAGNCGTLTATGALTYIWQPGGMAGATINVCPSTTTTYTVTGTGMNGCSSSDEVVAVVNTVIVSAGTDVTICSGNTSTLTASGATTYQWSPASSLDNATVASPVSSATNTTTYTVTGTTGSCSAMDEVIVNVNMTPVVTASGSDTICSGSQQMIIAAGATTYTWSPSATLDNSAAQNPIASPSTSTTYTVTGTANGCTATAEVYIMVNPTPIANAGLDVSLCSGGSTTLNGSAPGATSFIWSPAGTLDNSGILSPLATPSSTTTYTLSVSSGSCSSTDEVVVAVGSIAVNAGPDVSICSGNTVQLNGTAAGATSMLWSNGSTLDNPNILNPVSSTLTTTTYVLTASAGSCSGSDTVVVTVNSLPASPVITLSGADLVSSYATGNQWYQSSSVIGGATSQTYTPSMNDDYYVVYTDTNGCSSTSNVFTYTITSVKEVGTNMFMKLYPNPSNGIVYIQSENGNALDGYLIVRDMTGRIVYREEMHNSTQTILDLHNLAQGSYFIEATTEAGSRTFRLEINR